MDDAYIWIHPSHHTWLCKSCKVIPYNLMMLLILEYLQILKRRLPPRRVAGGLLNLRAFKSAAYSIYCASAFVIFLGLYTGQSFPTLCSREFPSNMGTLYLYSFDVLKRQRHFHWNFSGIFILLHLIHQCEFVVRTFCCW